MKQFIPGIALAFVISFVVPKRKVTVTPVKIIISNGDVKIVNLGKPVIANDTVVYGNLIERGYK